MQNMREKKTPLVSMVTVTGDRGRYSHAGDSDLYDLCVLFLGVFTVTFSYD